jgi:hypothetical protein
MRRFAPWFLIFAFSSFSLGDETASAKSQETGISEIDDSVAILEGNSSEDEIAAAMRNIDKRVPARIDEWENGTDWRKQFPVAFAISKSPEWTPILVRLAAQGEIPLDITALTMFELQRQGANPENLITEFRDMSNNDEELSRCDMLLASLNGEPIESTTQRYGPTEQMGQAQPFPDSSETPQTSDISSILPGNADERAIDGGQESRESPTSQSSPVWPYVLVVLALVGIVVVLLRSRKGNPGR